MKYIETFIALLIVSIASVRGVLLLIAIALITSTWFWLAVIALFLIARFS